MFSLDVGNVNSNLDVFSVNTNKGLYGTCARFAQGQ